MLYFMGDMDDQAEFKRSRLGKRAGKAGRRAAYEVGRGIGAGSKLAIRALTTPLSLANRGRKGLKKGLKALGRGVEDSVSGRRRRRRV